MQNEVNTFIFDFDSTLITSESPNEITKVVSNNNEEFVKSIEEATKACGEGVANNASSFVETFNKMLKTINVSKSSVKKAGKNFKITPGMLEVLDYLRSKNQKLMIISCGFLDCFSDIIKQLGIPLENCYYNKFLYDENGRTIGFQENILHSDNPHKKSILIEQLKKEGKIIGKSIMIGDGKNDLMTQEDNVVDYFIGFGVNCVRQVVKENSKIFVENMVDFLREIKNIVS